MKPLETEAVQFFTSDNWGAKTCPLVIDEEAVLQVRAVQQAIRLVGPVVGGEGPQTVGKAVLCLDVDRAEEHVGRLELPIVGRLPHHHEGNTDVGMKLRRGIPAKGDPRHRKRQLAHRRVSQGEEPRIVFPLRYSQHGVHANVHFMDRGKRMVAGRSDAHAATRYPAVIQLPTVVEAKIDAPEFRRDWLAGVRKDGIGLDEFVTDAARKTQGIERILPQWMGESEIFPDHLEVGRLS